MLTVGFHRRYLLKATLFPIDSCRTSHTQRSWRICVGRAFGTMASATMNSVGFSVCLQGVLVDNGVFCKDSRGVCLCPLFVRLRSEANGGRSCLCPGLHFLRSPPSIPHPTLPNFFPPFFFFKSQMDVELFLCLSCILSCTRFCV